MHFISENNFAALMGTSNATARKWAENGTFQSHVVNGTRGFFLEEINGVPEVDAMLTSNWDEERTITPKRDYTSVELFAGAGGLALGMSLAGFHHVLLNEFDHAACATLRANRPDWNVIEGDVRNVDFTPLRDRVDFLSGGFPCQAFSYAGKQGGFNDTRGTLFFELARAVNEIRPKVFLGENVKGLTSHDDGRTFQTIRNAIAELGYTLIEPRVLKAIMYQVPQKRERLILIAIRNDIAENVHFHWPSPYPEILTLRDALHPSVIFNSDAPDSVGVTYPPKKRQVLDMIPPGGDWRDLPEDIAREYLGGSWGLGGGKTGMARRLSLDEPSLTLTCSPCQKQTERCHPTETRPLNVREYARIQTFPDNWDFQGSVAERYKQIGNAVPVNLAWAVGRSIIRLLNEIQTQHPSVTYDCAGAVNEIMARHALTQATTTRHSPSKKKNPSIKMLNLFDTLELFPENIVENPLPANCEPTNLNIDREKNVLISYVKADNMEQYLDRSAKVYYTGHKFPSTVALNKLFYFMPYIKGKGVKDLYLIKIARVGTRREGQPDEDKNDLRLVFEIEYVGELFNDYKPIGLEIWHAFTDTTIRDLLKSN